MDKVEEREEDGEEEEKVNLHEIIKQEQRQKWRKGKRKN